MAKNTLVFNTLVSTLWLGYTCKCSFPQRKGNRTVFGRGWKKKGDNK